MCLCGHHNLKLLKFCCIWKRSISFHSFSPKEAERIREVLDNDHSFIRLVFRKYKEICESKAHLGVSGGKRRLLPEFSRGCQPLTPAPGPRPEGSHRWHEPGMETIGQTTARPSKQKGQILWLFSNLGAIIFSLFVIGTIKIECHLGA